MAGEIKQIQSIENTLKQLFTENVFTVDYFQRKYVWDKKNIEDLINDLTNEFLRNYKVGDSTIKVTEYAPYFMGEVIISINNGNVLSIIDGQQRITSLTLLLIYLKNKFKSDARFPGDINRMIYKDVYGSYRFNMDIPDRDNCMKALNEYGEYIVDANDSESVKNIAEAYEYIDDIWNSDINDKINLNINNAINFLYWLMERVYFSKITINDKELAYVVFEKMNDRGCPLTSTEMLRSYLLGSIKDETKRDLCQKDFDDAIEKLNKNKEATKRVKIDIEFFRNYLRAQYAETFDDNDNQSDLNRIGRDFHRWVYDKIIFDNDEEIIAFINKTVKYIGYYNIIKEKLLNRNTNEFLYLIANDDWDFTLQLPLILSSFSINDNEIEIIDKIKLVSKFISKLLMYRIWNQKSINQSALDTPIFILCSKIRGKELTEIKRIFDEYKIVDKLDEPPILKGNNKKRLKVFIAVITEILASNCEQPDYLLNKKNMEIEHIWANHFDKHNDEVSNEIDFINIRNTIGDLLVLPKTFNASFRDIDYIHKVEEYFKQNILAQTLNKKSYVYFPKLNQFIQKSKLEIKPYDNFYKSSIEERSELYKSIMQWNFKDL